MDMGILLNASIKKTVVNIAKYISICVLLKSPSVNNEDNVYGWRFYYRLETQANNNCCNAICGCGYNNDAEKKKL